MSSRFVREVLCSLSLDGEAVTLLFVRAVSTMDVWVEAIKQGEAAMGRQEPSDEVCETVAQYFMELKLEPQGLEGLTVPVSTTTTAKCAMRNE